MCLTDQNYFKTVKIYKVGYDNNDKKMESIYSKRIRAGKRRTYFFDVRATRGNDYYLTITESRKRFNDNGYDRHKIFLYKEDFNKFIKALSEAVDHVKTELMPDFDFDAFNHDEHPDSDHEHDHDSASEPNNNQEPVPQATATETQISPAAASPLNSPSTAPATSASTEDVDKW